MRLSRFYTTRCFLCISLTDLHVKLSFVANGTITELLVGNKMSWATVLIGLSNLVQKVTKVSFGQTGRYDNPSSRSQCGLLIKWTPAPAIRSTNYFLSNQGDEVTSLYRCVIRNVANRNEKGRVGTARSDAGRVKTQTLIKDAAC